MLLCHLRGTKTVLSPLPKKLKSPPPLSPKQPSGCLSWVNRIIFRRPLLKYEYPQEIKSNQSYRFLRDYFVLGTFNVLLLIFTPVLEGS